MSNQADLLKRTGNLAQNLTAALLKRIYDGEFQPGEKLPTESELMTSFGVSRTVVREAISGLQAAGLVDTRHGVGTFVLELRNHQPFNIQTDEILTALDVLAIMEIRISLEVEAAGLAASRRTDAHLHRLRTALDDFAEKIDGDTDNTIAADIAFHLTIGAATGNRYFHDVLKQLGKTLIPRSRVDSAAAAGDAQRNYLERVHLEHQSIYDAILHREADVARAAMRTHLANSRGRLRRRMAAAQMPRP